MAIAARFGGRKSVARNLTSNMTFSTESCSSTAILKLVSTSQHNRTLCSPETGLVFMAIHSAGAHLALQLQQASLPYNICARF